MNDTGGRDPGDLSRLLEELAAVPRPDVPDRYLSFLRPGTAVGRFIIEKEIGRGGFGVVYAALDPTLGRTVALKLIRPGTAVARKGSDWLRREAEAVARLAHANIVTLHDYGRSEEGTYLVFELLRGETLAARLTRGRLPVREAVRIGLDVARALAHAHEAKVLHRDLKPANVFLGADGTVKVLDFGIAHLLGQEGATSGGTPAYMAPEQWREESGDARTDLFALGVLLHEMLSGELPYGSRGVRPTEAAPALVSRLPRWRIPTALARLTRSLVQPGPEGRPASTRLVVERLEAVQVELDERRRPWRWVAMGSLLAAAAAGAALLFMPPGEAPAGERITAALTDAENLTGDPDLDRLADLVAVALGESRRVRLVSRDKLLASAGGLAPDGGRVDEATGRRLAELAGAHVLLVPSVRREGDGFEVALRGESAEGWRILFEARARAARKDAIPSALDEVVAEARRKLRERREDLRLSPVQLVARPTASLPAFREYVQGLDCVARPSELLGHIGYGTCGEHFERALAHDPGFALAHYQLAYLLASSGGSAAALKAHMDGALRSIDRLSRRDAELVRGWKAHLDGHDDEALAAYERVLAEHPDDKQVTYLAGDLLYHRGDYAGATPYFQAVLDLDRGAEWALDHLARCLAVTRRTKELTALADQLRAPPATAARRRVLLQVLTWLGRADEGVELARRAAEGGDDAARFDLAVALSAAGRVDEAEAVLAPLAEGKPEDVGLQMALMGYRVTLGRFRDVERMLLAPELGDKLEPYEHALYRALLAWARGDIRRLGEETMRGDRQQPGRLGALQVMVALHGDPELARRLAASLPADSTPAREVDALLAARSGHPVEASALLESLERTDPWPVNGVAPAYLLAEVAALAGDHEVVLAAVARFHRMFPMGFWRGHAFVRSLLLSARAHEALGRRDEARQDLSRVLALLRRADAELPLLREARALQARLAGGANR